MNIINMTKLASHETIVFTRKYQLVWSDLEKGNMSSDMNFQAKHRYEKAVEACVPYVFSYIINMLRIMSSTETNILVDMYETA